MIEDFFDHTCDIYHAVKVTKTRGYGLPTTEDEGLNYSGTPDIEDQACHFSVKTGTLLTVQQTPQQDLDARLKLTLPAGTDVRLNDKIISCGTGYEYLAEKPRNIRGHHVFVWVKRIYPKAL